MKTLSSLHLQSWQQNIKKPFSDFVEVLGYKHVHKCFSIIDRRWNLVGFPLLSKTAKAFMNTFAVKATKSAFSCVALLPKRSISIHFIFCNHMWELQAVCSLVVHICFAALSLLISLMQPAMTKVKGTQVKNILGRRVSLSAPFLARILFWTK